MRHTVSDGSGRYDPLDIASLQLWQQGQQEDNRQQISKSTVSRTLARCTQRLYRTLRYSL